MKMKKKLFIPLIAALLTIGLTSVGFAAWVISTPTEEDGQGSFTVYEVTDKTIVLDPAVTANKPEFGPSTTSFGTAAWLTFEKQNSEKENLNPTISFSITNWKQVYGSAKTIVLDNFKTSASDLVGKYFTLPSKQTITIAAAANETATPTITSNVDGAEPTIIVSGNVATITVKLDFDWGSYFGGMNPNDFYNNKKANDAVDPSAEGYIAGSAATWKAHASYHLEYFYNQLKSATYTCNLTASVNTTN